MTVAGKGGDVTSCFTLRTKRETTCDVKEKRDLNGD